MLRLVQFCLQMLLFMWRIMRVRKRASLQAVSYLQQIEHTFQGQFTPASFKKVKLSHSLYLPIVNDAFTQLHGRFTSLAEQERSIHYFICSTLFDNFWDDKTHTRSQIASMMFQPAAYLAQTFDEKVFVASHMQLLQHMPNASAYQKVLQLEFNAQEASMQQFQPHISNIEIQEITFAKGGNAVLLCRYYLDVQPTHAEEQCWYLLGSLIQFSNDLFDIYKDLQDGIHTLATRCTNAHDLEALFMQQVQALQQQILLLPYSKKRLQQFSMAMASTYSLGLVALHQLKQTQGNAAELPPLNSLPRKALIIDMEKPQNVLLWAKKIYQNMYWAK